MDAEYFRFGGKLLHRLAMLAIACGSLSSAALADVPDLTSSMVSLGNPGKVRWPDSPTVRACTDLQFYQGKLYNSGGEVETNPGPVYIHTIDPYTHKIKFEVSVSTEEIASYHITSWGDLVAPAEDPAGSATGPLNITPLGKDIFVRNPEGTWSSVRVNGSTVNGSDSHTLAYNTHTWDIVEYDGHYFSAGYGLVCFSNQFATYSDGTWWTNATASATITVSYGGAVMDSADVTWLRRQVHFLKFPNALYAVPNELVYSGTMEYNGMTLDFSVSNLELSRWNSTSNRFEEARFELSNLCPDLSSNDLTMVAATANADSYHVRVWKPTSFKNRELYVLSIDDLEYSTGGSYTYSSYPLSLAGYSAVNDATADGGKGLPQATRIAFGDQEYPYDYAVYGDVVYALTGHYNSTTKQVVHAIWKSTDGLNFTKILTFNFHEAMVSLEYRDGWFYVGEGNYKGTPGWPNDGTASDAGAIYRMRLPQEPIQVVATTETDTLDEGSSKTYGFKLSSAPTTNLTLKVAACASQTVTLDKSSLTFTPSNWETEQTVTATLVNDSVEDTSMFAVVCGAESDDIERGEFASPEVTSGVVEITPVDDESAAVVSAEAVSTTTNSATYAITTSSLGKVGGSEVTSAAVTAYLYFASTGTVAIATQTGTLTADGVPLELTFTGLNTNQSYRIVAEVVTATGVSMTTDGKMCKTKSGTAWEKSSYVVADWTVPSGRLIPDEYTTSTMFDGSITTFTEYPTSATNVFAWTTATNLTAIQVYVADNAGTAAKNYGWSIEIASVAVKYEGGTDFVTLGDSYVLYSEAVDGASAGTGKLLTYANPDGSAIENVVAVRIINGTWANNHAVGIGELVFVGATDDEGETPDPETVTPPEAGGTNVTSVIALLGNPATNKWSTAVQARSIVDLQSWDGKVFIATGDRNDTTGPTPLWAFDKSTKTFTNEFYAGTESIETLRVLADGCLYAPAAKPRTSGDNCGVFFRRDRSGNWAAYSASLGNLTSNVVDMEVLGKRYFISGYGLASSTNLTDWTDVGADSMDTTRPYSLIRCGGDLFAIGDSTVQFTSSADTATVVSGTSATMYRWDPSTGKFQSFANDWANVVPGLTHADAQLELGKGSAATSATVRPWHVTPFGTNTLYIVGDAYVSRTFNGVANLPSGSRPMIAVSACAADDGNGGRTLKGQRITLPSGYFPVDICAYKGSAYLLALAYNGVDQTVRHGVWMTTDGVNFERIMTIDYPQPMLSITALNNYLYFGVGHQSSLPALGTLQSGITDTAGSVYRVYYDTRDTSVTPFHRALLNLDAMRALGITGRGVRVGVVDGPINEVTLSDGSKDLAIAKRAGSTAGNGHGLEVCSLVASQTFGVAPDCELYVYDAGNSTAAAQVHKFIAGLWWCATNGCKVINMSAGFNPAQTGVMELHDYFNEELRKIKEQTGVILIVSNGNNYTNDHPYFPQDTDLCICIGGITQDKQPANLTKNWRQDFCAFGWQVWSFVNSTGGASFHLDGTSFSAPMATGLVALLLQQNPTLTQDEVYGIFKDSREILAEGRTREYGWGLLQASIVQNDYKRQAAYDAEKAARIKLQSITLNNPGITYSETQDIYDMPVKIGTTFKLDYTPNPTNATDPRAYWYAGNLNNLNPILADDILTVKNDTSLIGSLSTYDAFNGDYDELLSLRLHFWAIDPQSDHWTVDTTADTVSFGDWQFAAVADTNAYTLTVGNPTAWPSSASALDFSLPVVDTVGRLYTLTNLNCQFSGYADAASRISSVTLGADLVSLASNAFQNATALRTITFKGLPPADLQTPYLAQVGSAATITTCVPEDKLTTKNSAGMCWNDYAAGGTVGESDTTWAAAYIDSSVTLAQRPLIYGEPATDVAPTIASVVVSDVTTNSAVVEVAGSDLDSGSLKVEIYDVDGNLVLTSATLTDWGSVTITGLTPSTIYKARAIATNGTSGKSTTYADVAFTTDAASGGEGGGDSSTVPDLTSSLEYVGNPTLEKWSTPIYASSVMDLQTYRGKIYLGTGDYSANAGPIPVWAYDPTAAAFTNEFSAGTESIEIIRVLSDGRLYIPSTDPSGGTNNGSLFRRELDGSWTVIPEYSAYCNTHMYDVELCQNKLFVCGYNTMKSTDYGVTWTNGEDDTWIYGNRLYSLVRCGDALFSHCECQMNFSSSGTASGNVYMLRLVGDMLQLTSHSHLNYIAPDIKLSDTYLVMGDDVTAPSVTYRFWHPTPFGNRNLYVVGDTYTSRTYTSPVAASNVYPAGTRPMMAASAYATTNAQGKAEMHADRITLPDGYYPIDFCVSGDTAYMLAFAYNSTDKNVRHGVWKTTDGTTFTQILSFDFQQAMMSLEYLDGYFYFGVAHKKAMIELGELASGTSEKAGCIYRVRLQQSIEKANVSVTAGADADYSNSQNGSFTFSRAAGASTTNPLTVYYSVSGTATAGTSYTALSGAATIPAGESSVTVSVVPLDSGISEDKTVIVTISEGDYTVATGSASILVKAISTPDPDPEPTGAAWTTGSYADDTYVEVANRLNGNKSANMYDGNASTRGEVYTGNNFEYTFSEAKDITDIRIYTSWDDTGRVGFKLSNIQVKYDGASDYTELADTAIDYSSSSNPSTNRLYAALAKAGGNIATNVVAVKVVFETCQNGYIGVAEIEVAGTASESEPEPTQNYWVLDTTARTMTWGGWTFSTGIIDSNKLTFDVRGCTVYPDAVSPLDFSLPVMDANGNSYTITSLNTYFTDKPVAASRVGELTFPGEGLLGTGYAAFTGCTNATGVIKFPSTFYYLSGETFSNCKKLSILGSSMASITSGSSASVNSSLGAAFTGVSFVGEVYLPLMQEITGGAFANSNVESIRFGAALKRLGRVNQWSQGCFYNCAKLTNVVFDADSRVSLEWGETFRSCKALRDVDLSVVTNITCDRFIYNDGANTNTNYGVFYGCTSLTNVTLGADLAFIASNTFQNATALTSIIFKGLPPANLGLPFLSKVSATQKVTTYVPADKLDTENASGMCWNDYAAGGTVSASGTTWASSYVESSVTDLSYRPLVCVGGSVVTDYWVYDSTAKTITDGLWTFNATLSGSNITVGSITDDGYPSKISPLDFSKKVIKSGDASTEYTIKEIGALFFYYSSGDAYRPGADRIGKFTLPGNGLVTMSNDGPNSNCGTNMFGDIVVPSTVTSIGRRWFKGTKITSVTFDGCTATVNGAYSGAGPFQNCSALTSVVFTASANCTLISGFAFQNCTSLKEVDFSGVVSVATSDETSASKAFFSGCTALKKITIGSKLTRFPNNVLFNGNTSLETVHFLGLPPAEFGTPYLTEIRSSQAVTTIVPAEYATATNANGISWKSYAASQTLNTTSSTWASGYVKSDVTDLTKRLLIVDQELTPVSGYAAWVAEKGLTGDDAAWDAKPTMWGGKLANAFIYTYGEGLVNGTTYIMTISFDADGNPVVTTPAVIDGHTDFTPAVIGVPTVTDWTTPIVLEATGNNWTLPSGKSANFFRVRITK